MNLQAMLDQIVREHNELHANIQAGEAQLAAMREQRQQLLGQVSILQEILKDAAADTVNGDSEGKSDL